MDQLSEVRQSALDMTRDIFNIGMKYVKHKTLATFFLGIFKPRIESIIVKEAPEQELVNVMWAVKRKIDPTLAKLNQVEAVLETKSLNDPKIQAAVEAMILKNNNFAPVENKIDTEKAAEILARLRHG